MRKPQAVENAQQGGSQALAGALIQPGLAARPARALERFHPLASPGVVPPAGGLAADLQAANDLGLGMALMEEGGGLHAPGFQGRKVPARPKISIHTLRIAQFLRDVNITVLCEVH